MLNRMVELATKSANGTYSLTERTGGGCAESEGVPLKNGSGNSDWLLQVWVLPAPEGILPPPPAAVVPLPLTREARGFCA